MSQPTDLQLQVLSSIEQIAEQEWDHCLPGELECWRYYRAVERAGLPGFELGYIAVREAGRLSACAPFFIHEFRLDTLMEGRIKACAAWLAARWPRLLSLRLACLGSPVTEVCHLGLLPGLSAAEREVRCQLVFAALEGLARERRIGLLAVKDASDYLRDACTGAAFGYTRMPGMPGTLLPLPHADLDGYLATLSSATRKNLRRKQRSAAKLSIEERSEVGDVLPELMQLYRQTRAASELQFEELPDAYFREVLQALPGRTRCVLYYADGQLLAFNLLLHDGRRLLDKFVGMDGQRARDYDLYFVSWLYNVRWCIERQIPLYEPGQAGYEVKRRLGCRLLANWYYFRHRNVAINFVLRVVVRVLRLDRFDADVQDALEAT